MVEQVEITSLDLRYQGYRMRCPGAEKALLLAILEKGIRDPLCGIDTEPSRILLDGFKRYRCAKKLGLGIVPYPRKRSETGSCPRTSGPCRY